MFAFSHIVIFKLNQHIKQLRTDRNSKEINLAKLSSRIIVTQHVSCNMIFERPYTVFTNGGHVGKNWCQVMEARLCKINKNCKSRLSVNLRVFSTDSTLNNFVRTFFKYNYVGSLQPLMFSTDILFSIKRDAYMFKETGWFCRFPNHPKFDKWAMAAEKRQTCWPRLHIKTESESQLTTIL